MSSTNNYLVNDESKWYNLVLNGGSTKGIAHLGVMCFLEEKKLLKDITCYAGTSIGAVIIIFHSSGFSALDIWDFISKMDLKKLFKPDIFSSLKNLGLDDGKIMEATMEDMLFATFGIPQITFQQHYDITKKELIITGTNMTLKTLEIYSYKHTPQKIISKCGRISGGVPIMYTPVINEKGETLVDGAFMNNFPIDLVPITNTLGIKINAVLDTKYNYPEEYIMALLNLCQYCAITKPIPKNADIIEIDFEESISSFNFSLDQEAKEKLFQIGYESARKFYRQKLESFI
jgi:NTE family protein